MDDKGRRLLSHQAQAVTLSRLIPKITSVLVMLFQVPSRSIGHFILNFSSPSAPQTYRPEIILLKRSPSPILVMNWAVGWMIGLEAIKTLQSGKTLGPAGFTVEVFSYKESPAPTLSEGLNLPPPPSSSMKDIFGKNVLNGPNIWAHQLSYPGKVLMKPSRLTFKGTVFPQGASPINAKVCPWLGEWVSEWHHWSVECWNGILCAIVRFMMHIDGVISVVNENFFGTTNGVTEQRSMRKPVLGSVLTCWSGQCVPHLLLKWSFSGFSALALRWPTFLDQVRLAHARPIHRKSAAHMLLTLSLFLSKVHCKFPVPSV